MPADNLALELQSDREKGSKDLPRKLAGSFSIRLNRPMISGMGRPANIVEYINDAPKDAQAKLRQMRACLRKAAPRATESLKWGMPAFSYDRILFTFAAFQKDLGHDWVSRLTVRLLTSEASTLIITAER